jgi:hypothetical protein
MMQQKKNTPAYRRTVTGKQETDHDNKLEIERRSWAGAPVATCMVKLDSAKSEA